MYLRTPACYKIIQTYFCISRTNALVYQKTGAKAYRLETWASRNELLLYFKYLLINLFLDWHAHHIIEWTSVFKFSLPTIKLYKSNSNYCFIRIDYISDFVTVLTNINWNSTRKWQFNTIQFPSIAVILNEVWNLSIYTCKQLHQASNCLGIQRVTLNRHMTQGWVGNYFLPYKDKIHIPQENTYSSGSPEPRSCTVQCPGIGKYPYNWTVVLFSAVQHNRGVNIPPQKREKPISGCKSTLLEPTILTKQ